MVGGNYPGSSYPGQGYAGTTTISTLNVPFIAATTTLYTPTLSATGTAPLTVPFITSTTTLYAITLRRSGVGAQPLGVSISFDDPTLESAPTWTRLDA